VPNLDKDHSGPLQTARESLLGTWIPVLRQEGSHRSYVKEGIARPIVIPTYTELPIAIIRSNLRTDGISREEYFRLLSEG
jgi:hypothetical protein